MGAGLIRLASKTLVGISPAFSEFYYDLEKYCEPSKIISKTTSPMRVSNLIQQPDSLVSLTSIHTLFQISSIYSNQRSCFKGSKNLIQSPPNKDVFYKSQTQNATLPLPLNTIPNSNMLRILPSNSAYLCTALNHSKLTRTLIRRSDHDSKYRKLSRIPVRLKSNTNIHPQKVKRTSNTTASHRAWTKESSAPRT